MRRSSLNASRTEFGLSHPGPTSSLGAYACTVSESAARRPRVRASTHNGCAVPAGRARPCDTLRRPRRGRGPRGSRGPRGPRGPPRPRHAPPRLARPLPPTLPGVVLTGIAAIRLALAYLALRAEPCLATAPRAAGLWKRMNVRVRDPDGLLGEAQTRASQCDARSWKKGEGEGGRVALT